MEVCSFLAAQICLRTRMSRVSPFLKANNISYAIRKIDCKTIKIAIWIQMLNLYNLYIASCTH